VAKKIRRKQSRLKALLFFVLAPFVVWALAFLIWFYWYNLFGRSDNTPPAKAGKEVEQSTQSSDKSTQERIGEEDRRKLEEILKSKK
jgi:cytoskeletal protein RodZ